MNSDLSQVWCNSCNGQGCSLSEDDGRYYCVHCNTLVEDVVDNANADEDFIISKDGGATYDPHFTRSIHSIKPEPYDPDHMGPCEPVDFGGAPKGYLAREEDYYKSIRKRYILGVQLMVQYQCEKLVEEFQVNPIICGIVGKVWLRFVASKRVFSDAWADDAIKESEIQEDKKVHKGSNVKYQNEPRNLYQERMAMIWCKSLKKTIPLSSSLAVSYLACHIAREAVLPSDIRKWAIEGKLPYFGVFPKIASSIKEIERSNNCPSIICPLEANFMFRPIYVVSIKALESMAASIAQSTGLNLPPVNFFPIASRYLRQLSLPVEKIIPYACRIQEWAMPPELWLSANELRIPSRVCVMSILIVTIRILYNINGFGKWEMTLSAPIEDSSMDDNTASSDESDAKDDAKVMPTAPTMDVDPEGTSPPVHIFESDCAELLQTLEKKYGDSNIRYEFSKDLYTYLQYCKDVVFTGLEPPYKDPDFIDKLWEYFEKNREGVEVSKEFEASSHERRSRDSCKQFDTTKNHMTHETTISPCADNSGSMSQGGGPECSDNTLRDSEPHQTSESPEKHESSQELRDKAVRHLKIDMEEHRFTYIPPRVKVKRHDYLHYRRKRAGDGSYTYIAHADYYILLRACAKVAEVDTRVMHYSVLSLERRLGWIEKRIDQCVQCYKNPSTSDPNS